MKQHFFGISVCLGMLIPMTVPISSASGQSSAGTAAVLNPDTIIKIAYERNPRIAAARHKLRSSEYNYKLFESEYSQFIPLIMDSRVQRTSDSSEDNPSGRLTAGLRKEFFDGSSASLDVGNETQWDSNDGTHNQFIEGQVEFPLFSSNRKLSRVIERTFEENELHNANLDYVEQVREILREAQEEYYDLISRARILNTLRKYKKRLEALPDEPWVRDHPADARQIEDEVNSLDSDIKGLEVTVSSLEIRLQREIGLESLEGFRIEPVPLGLGESDYYGEHYIEESTQAVVKRAMVNDVEIKVLHRVMESAKEKKRLAEQGRWDTFVSIGGQYSYAGFNGDDNPEKGYSVGMGLKVKKFDAKVLDYSRLKAEADIRNVEARIKDRELQTAARIRQEKGEAANRRKQLESLYESLQSRERIYTLKLESYLKGEKSIDNLIQTFRSLLDTEEAYCEAGNRYFDNIRDLDYLCAVYFRKLGIETK
jgi:outer membrane protein TolC